MKMETLQQRRDELERKEQKLKESLLRFDKFLKVPPQKISPKKEQGISLRNMLREFVDNSCF